MTEQLFHNRRPLGQKAKALLQQAKIAPDPEVLYVLQLAQWLLDENKRELPGLQERKHAHLMQDLVNQLDSRPPKAVHKMFLSPDFQKAGVRQAGEEQLLQGDLKTPESLAVRLVENLYANLANQSPSLNPAHSLT